MGKVTVTQTTTSDGNEYYVVCNPSVEERKYSAVRASMTLSQKEFDSLMAQGLVFVGSRLKVVR